MTSAWPAISYDQWGATCDTLHAHTQVLGKLAVELAPLAPELHHGALRVTARGWETAPLPARNGSGSLVVALDLHSHQAVVEHSDGHAERVPLTPDRPVADVTKEVLAAVTRLGGHVRINPVPQEVPWDVPPDEDYEHTRYDPAQVGDYFAAATQAPCRVFRAKAITVGERRQILDVAYETSGRYETAGSDGCDRRLIASLACANVAR
jgi:Family of unknown function (DUF5996)